MRTFIFTTYYFVENPLKVIWNSGIHGNRSFLLEQTVMIFLVEVRKAAQGVVVSWFNFLDRDPILLLRRLDTEGVPKTSKLCLDNLLPKLSEEDLIGVINKWADDYLDEK